MRKPWYRIRPNWPVRGLLLGLFAVGAIYIFLIPTLFYANHVPGIFDDRPPLADRFRDRGLDVVASLWFFTVGATIGSFLNVVAYRMPQRLTLIWQPSRCPYCYKPIKFRHNLPILGWFWLRGRCGRCRLPISVRYLWVEVLCGAIFLSLLWFEIAAGGDNLPLREPARYRGVMWTLFSLRWELIGLFVYHATLLSIMVVTALIAWDRLRLPASLIVFAILTGLSLAVLLPLTHPVPWNFLWPEWLASANAFLSRWLGVDAGMQFATSLVGFAAGGIFGIGQHIAARIGRRFASATLHDTTIGSNVSCEFGEPSIAAAERSRNSQETSTIGWEYLVGSLLVGTFLGWQSLAVIVLCVAMGRLLAPRLPWSMWLLFVSWFHIVVWRAEWFCVMTVARATVGLGRTSVVAGVVAALALILTGFAAMIELPMAACSEDLSNGANRRSVVSNRTR